MGWSRSRSTTKINRPWQLRFEYFLGTGHCCHVFHKCRTGRCGNVAFFCITVSETGWRAPLLGGHEWREAILKKPFPIFGWLDMLWVHVSKACYSIPMHRCAWTLWANLTNAVFIRPRLRGSLQKVEGELNKVHRVDLLRGWSRVTYNEAEWKLRCWGRIRLFRTIYLIWAHFMQSLFQRWVSMQWLLRSRPPCTRSGTE